MFIPKIMLAPSAGFCMGVKRAVEMALNAVGKYPAPLQTIGQLIHNNAVVDYLSAQGISVGENSPVTGTVIIRAHGLPPSDEENLLRSGLAIIDATCPLVKKSQQIITTGADAGKYVIVVGDADHAEMKGLIARAPRGGKIISSLAEAEQLTNLDNAILLAQTTFSHDEYHAISDFLQARFPTLIVYDTICAATEKRQAEVRELTNDCDLIIIIGGKHSANTRRLAEVAQSANCHTIFIEDENELNLNDLPNAKCIGISAGASTPDWTINAVINKLQSGSNDA